MMFLPLITLLSMGITTIISFLLTISIFSAYKKTGDILIRAFIFLFLGFSLMHFFLTISSFFSALNSQIAGFFYLVAYYILFFTFTLFIYFLTELFFFKIKGIILKTLSILVLISSFLISLNPPLPKTISAGITEWNVPLFTTRIVGGYSFLIFVLNFFIFVNTLLKTKEKIYKIRFFFFIFGFLIFVIASPLHNFAKNIIQYFLADILTPIGILFILLGILLPKFSKKQEQI
jgi:hypothetical protein